MYNQGRWAKYSPPPGPQKCFKIGKKDKIFALKWLESEEENQGVKIPPPGYQKCPSLAEILLTLLLDQWNLDTLLDG